MAGKPKRPGELKDALVTVRMPADQLEALAHEAGMAGLSTAAYCRALISGRRPALRNEVVLDASQVLPAVWQLARVGNNLNQIARWLKRDAKYETWTTERYRHRELETAKRNVDAILGGRGAGKHPRARGGDGLE